MLVMVLFNVALVSKTERTISAVRRMKVSNISTAMLLSGGPCAVDGALGGA